MARRTSGSAALADGHERRLHEGFGGALAHWRTGFDWRAQEHELNHFQQFTVPLAGIDVHLIHGRGLGPAPLPLLLSHGWPGSVFEFRRLIPMLTDPACFGADPDDAFTVFAPSLPG